METYYKENTLYVHSSQGEGKKKKKEISLAYKMKDLIWKLGKSVQFLG